MMKRAILNMLKYEYSLLSRSDRTKGLLIYAAGLPFISYGVMVVSDSVDSVLGLCFVSICFMNLFYAPVQFLWDQHYYEGFFSKDFDFGILVKAKLLFLQIENTIIFLLLLPLIVSFFDFDRILFIFSVFFYCCGFASPVAILLSGISFKYIYNSFHPNDISYNLKIKHIVFGVIPFIPEVLSILILSSKITFLYIINIAFGLIGIFLTTRICKIVKQNILINKFFLK